MMNMNCALTVLFSLTLVSPAAGQHEHGDSADEPKRPKIFLDKSPRIVEYQLNRLSNEQLLLVETGTDDVKYLPVFKAILTREGVSRADRDDALAAMAKINKSHPVKELADVLASLKPKDAAGLRTVQTLATMLLSQPTEALQEFQPAILPLVDGSAASLRQVGFAALIAAGASEQSLSLAKDSSNYTDLFDSLALIKREESKLPFYDIAVEQLSGSEEQTRLAALRALAHIQRNADNTFVTAASVIKEPALRAEAIRTMLSTEPGARDSGTSQELITWLVDFAEKTPAEKRTTGDFLDAMELVEQLLAKAPKAKAKQWRSRLRGTVVRVVRIHTVEEEMRYDVPYFAVEAGRPVQIVLINEDLMPHNLVVTTPGSLKEVAEEGLAAGPNNGLDNKQYVPKSDKVLFATNMIATREQERLTFDAPATPGEYPYVCTFPRHWMRMYGVMIVVEDLDAWNENPTKPEDPVGSNRQFVKSWQMDDFADLASNLRGRSPAIGERIFTEASCGQCHKAGQIGVGGVGPDLAGTMAKLQSDPRALLQEILDPSHRIEEKYAMQLFLDLDGQTYSGLVVAEDKDSVQLLENPEAKEPIVLLKDDIEERIKTPNSMMPKGLMDQYSQDEIMELLSFIISIQKPDAAP